MVHVLPQQLDGRLSSVGLKLRHVEVVDEDYGLLSGRRPKDPLSAPVQLGINEVLGHVGRGTGTEADDVGRYIVLGGEVVQVLLDQDRLS